MDQANKMITFVKYANFSNENLEYFKKITGKNTNQLIRDSFELLKSSLKIYDNTTYSAKIICNIVNLIIVLCRSKKFSEEEIDINKKRIKRSRTALYNQNSNDKLLEAINLLDAITLEQNIDAESLTKLVKILIDKLEDVDIIKIFININKSIITDNTEIFDYVFDKILVCLNNNSRDIYYYITLLKIVYSSKINKNNYLSKLYNYETNIFTTEIRSIVRGFRRPYSPETILKKYDIIENPVEEKIISPYKKTTTDRIITIDKNRTFIRDDAISIKKDGNKYIVKIYITDAGGEIGFGTQTDKDAYNNYKSMYLPNHRIHMLNVNTEEKVSLNKHKLRRAFTLEVVFNDSGDIIDYNLSKDNITVSENFSYSSADNLLNCASKDNDYYFLNDLYYISQALANNNKARIKYWELKENASSNQERNMYKSDSMISEYMILYNRLLAVIAKDNSFPYIYRGKEKEYISNIMNSLGIEITGKIKNLLASLYLNSKYSQYPTAHAGLGFDCYSHSSSPGRRYVDLYNQYLYHMFYFKDKKYCLNEKELDYLIEYLNQRNRELELMNAEYVRSLNLKNS